MSETWVLAEAGQVAKGGRRLLGRNGSPTTLVDEAKTFHTKDEADRDADMAKGRYVATPLAEVHPPPDPDWMPDDYTRLD